MDNNFKHAFMVFVFLFLVLVIIDPILVNAQTGSISLPTKILKAGSQLVIHKDGM
jgi:hypothetical protein